MSYFENYLTSVKNSCNNKTYSGDIFKQKWCPNCAPINVIEKSRENFEIKENFLHLGPNTNQVLSLQDPSNPWSYKAFYDTNC